MKKIMYLCAIAVFILALAGFARVTYAHTVRVGLVRVFYNQDSISVSTTSIDIGHGNANGSFEFNRTLNSANGFTIHTEGGQVVVRAGGQTVFTFLNDAAGGPQIRASGGGILAMGSYTFRGAIEFRPSGARVTAINVICLEEYLYGVLPMEMSPSFHIEALRAQAVAARTFAMYTMNSRSYAARGFDLCDRTCCQAYRGAGREEEIMIQAVRDTRGLMMFTEDRDTPAFTPYFSSSGGATDNSENVWGSALSHLRGVIDIYEQNPRIWSRTYTWTQLTAAVRAQAPSANIGTVTGVTIAQEHLGRVQELTFIGTNGQWTATRQQILTVFRHIDRSLYSRNFYFVGSGTGASLTVNVTCGNLIHSAPITSFYVIDHTGNVRPITTASIFDGITTRRLNQTFTVTGGTGITISGRGWGHGVGMSQTGANSMAQAGHDFRAILQHYYTGITIREWIRY